MKRDNIDLVQRVTGGKAVWHEKEITYAISSPIDSKLFGNSLKSSYQVISKGLLLFFDRLGIQEKTIKTESSTIRNNSPICFYTTGIYEISQFSNKMVGSAQKRNKKAFLQHGSIPIFQSQSKLNDYFLNPCKENKKKVFPLSKYTSNININYYKYLLLDSFFSAWAKEVF